MVGEKDFRGLPPCAPWLRACLLDGSQLVMLVGLPAGVVASHLHS